MNDVNERNSQALTERPKMSRLATASPITFFLAFLALRVSWWLFVGSMLAALVFGIVADRHIRTSRGKLRGRMLTILGATPAFVVLLFVAIVGRPIDRDIAYRLYCGVNMSGLGKAMQVYAGEFDGRLPTAEKWCDILAEHAEVTPKSFVCKSSGAVIGQSCYAMNKNVVGKKLSDLVPDVVLLFEAEPGWNQVGGPEMLVSDRHKGRKRKGSNILFADGHVDFIKTEDVGSLLWECSSFRRPNNSADLKYWLENMIWYHRFTDREIRVATGLTQAGVEAAKKMFDISAGNRTKLAEDAPLLVLPYPGGRHPRIGFLEGAIDPQRETKFSVFTTWDADSYVVLDIPEAIWSNLGLTYLAHKHIDTIWSKQGIELEKLEWNLHPDGGLDIERKLPNGIAFGVKVKPTRQAVLMEMWIENGTDKKLTDLRVQNCVMTKMAKGFEQQTNDNKVLTNPYAACKSSDGKRWIITAWEGCHNPWANDKCPCFHSDPKFPDLEPGQKETLRGRLSFYEGEDIEGEFARIEATGWRR